MDYSTFILIRSDQVALIINPVDLSADGTRKGDGGKDARFVQKTESPIQGIVSDDAAETIDG